MSNINSRLFNFCLVSLVILLFYSCNTYNFSHPLPSDKSNIYEFPSAWQGKWMDADSQQLIIGHNFAALVIRDSYNVVKGVWPKKNEKGEFVYPQGVRYSGMYAMIRDSLDKPKDTVANYVVNEGHIYEINGKGRLEKGYHFTIDKDTFRISTDDTFWVDLGRNAFLRELNKDLYVLNVLGQAIGRESQWWHVVALEKTGQNSIERWDCSYNLIKDSSMFYSKYDDYYFNSTWKTAALIKLIRNGSFEKCSPFWRID